METSDRSRINGVDATSLPAAAHIGVVTLQVSQLDRSIDYYTNVLGFQVREHAPSIARLGAAGEPHLLELHEHAGAAAARRPQLGLYHFAILLPDRAQLGRLIGHLAARHVQPGAADHLVSEAIYLYDPDGLGIEVYADRPRSLWRMQAGELAMASDPLDLRSLLDAGGSTPWKGMPAGTTVGHMHLSVGDLPEARRFYHDLLGLDVMVTRYPGALFLSAGGYHHHLGLNTWAGPAAQPAAVDAARLQRWELVVPRAADAAAAADRVRAGGFAVNPVPGEQSWEAVDPWGIHLRIRAG